MFVFVLVFMIFANINIASAIDPVTHNVDVNGEVEYYPTTLAFLSAPQVVERGQYSTQFTIQIQNDAGYPVVMTSDVDVNLASTSATGQFFDAPSGSVITSATIATGSSTATFYYRDNTAGNFNISISRAGWTSSSQPILIQDTTPPNPPVVGSPANGSTLTTRTPTFTGTADPGTTILITINGTTYSTTVDAGGNWTLTWPVDLPDGTYSASIVARDSYGNSSTPVVISFSILVSPPTTPTPTPTPTATPTTPVAVPLKLEIIIDNITTTFNNSEQNIVKYVLVNTDMTFLVSPSLSKPVASVEGFINGIKYVFNDTNGDGIYESSIVSPQIPGNYDLKIVVTYQDGQVEELNMKLIIDPPGYVYEVVNGTQQKMEGVNITLWVYKDGKWQVWDAKAYNQTNPQFTGANGEYKFIVPEGLYYITAEKDGYEMYKSHTMYISNGNPININLKMTKTGASGFIGSIGLFFSNLATDIDIFLAPFVYSDFAQDTYMPINIAAAIFFLLATLLLQIMNMSLLSPFSNILARLSSFFGVIPRKKKSWGVVYDSETGKPIAMAVVQIFDREFGKLLETQVTDKDGRFGFMVKTGEYIIKVVKQNYIFPSKLHEADYHGQVVKVSDKIILTINIPLDPNIASLTKKLLSINRIYKVVNVIRLVLLVVGTFYSFSFAVVEGSTLNYVIFAIYIVAWVNEIYIRIVSAKAFSKVYDVKNNDGVDLGIVRVFNQEGKIMATRVSDTSGNFAFLVGKGDYRLTITKENYDQFESENLHFHKGDTIKKKFGIKPRAGGTSPQTSES